MRTSDEAVRGATGRGYDGWFALLDESGAEGRTHGEIAASLMTAHGVDHWWSQKIVPVERLFEALVDPRLRDRWLPGAVLRERTSQPGRAARFDYRDGATRVNVGFAAKGEAKSQVALAHERLPDAEGAEEAKLFWRERLTELKALLEGTS
jgi:hypothetical protein